MKDYNALHYLSVAPPTHVVSYCEILHCNRVRLAFAVTFFLHFYDPCIVAVPS